MADIKLVVKIPEEMYAEIMDENGIETMLIPYSSIVRNGVPLPKVHGRLIDADLLKAKLIYESDIGAEIETYGTDDVIKRVFDNAPTIIEAESEG